MYVLNGCGMDTLCDQRQFVDMLFAEVISYFIVQKEKNLHVGGADHCRSYVGNIFYMILNMLCGNCFTNMKIVTEEIFS